MVYEHYRQPLLPASAFALRMLRSVIFAAALLVVTLLFGAVLFHYSEQLSWLDAFLNSVLIMTGLGLVNIMNTAAGKIFTAFYALLSTLVFYTVLAIILTPLLHRLLHRMHLDIESRKSFK